MGVIVIVAYKPKPGKAGALKELAKTHIPRLKQEGLVTDREPVMMETADGTIMQKPYKTRIKTPPCSKCGASMPKYAIMCR
jgi:hypothetical protein